MIRPIFIESQESVEALKKRLDALQKRILREQAARKSAENILEKKSLELYNAHEELKKLILSLKDKLVESEKTSNALKKALDTAIQASKVKSSFLATMSHELRTPLNGVIGIASLLERTKLDEEQTEYLQILQSSSKVLLDLINDVLDYAKIESGHIELDLHSFNLHALTAETLELYAATAYKKKLELIYFLDNKVPRQVKGDSHRIRQILANLLSNAIKFTEAGEIMLLMSAVEMDNQSIMIIGEVDDTGIGISEEHIDRLFDEFQQADPSHARKYGGTGLGLSIARRLIECMGGALNVTSKVDKGSRFVFSFVIEVDETQDQRTDSHPLKEKAVTLIIDNEKNRFILESILKRWEMQPTACLSVREAFIYLQQEKNPCDVVIIDVEDQLFKGVNLITPLKKIRNDVPMLLVQPVGSTREIDETNYNELRIFKPINPESLHATLVNILNQPRQITQAKNT